MDAFELNKQQEDEKQHDAANETPPTIGINVGSRKSQLALVQTNFVVNKLEEFYSNNPDQLVQFQRSKYVTEPKLKFNIVSMTTTGDQNLDKPLPEIGTKSLFTRELEIALLEGKVDFVVHSLKDLPTTLPQGCAIGAILKRDSPDDVIVLKRSLRSLIQPLSLLSSGRVDEGRGMKFKVGTSSQRRIAMVRRCNPDLECIDIRGNLNTRISKLDKDDGEYDAIILAKAGLDRLGWSERASSLLTPRNAQELADWCYAVGQGALAVECRSDDNYILNLLSPIIDFQTTYEVIAERSLMKKLEGGCSVPLGVRTAWTNDDRGKTLHLESIVLSIDGKSVVKANGKTRLSDRSDETNIGANSDMTTGVIISNAALTSSDISQNMIESSILGVEVAKKMISLGCLDLMRRGKYDGAEMDEIYKYQESIADSMRQENNKFSELDEAHNLDQMISKARDYQEKLVNIKRSMLIIKDRTTKLKRKADRILEDKNREDLEKQRSRERREMLERHLEPVVNTKRDG